MQAARSCRNVCWVVPDFVQCVGCSGAEHPLSRITLVIIFRNDRTKPSRAINTMIATEAWRRQAPQTGAQCSSTDRRGLELSKNCHVADHHPVVIRNATLFGH